MTIICYIRSFLQPGFRFQYQLINLVWLSFYFFSFSWSLSICISAALYSCVCSCPKILRNYLLFIIIHIFSTHFAINLGFFWVFWHKLKTSKTMDQQPDITCEGTKSKQKQNQVTSHSNWPRALLFDLAHRKCNGIMKGWFHCLTSESNERFPVNSILIFGSSWCLVMMQIQFF